ncbi:hypothetical protein GWI33_003148 [Rhynchophorus ferrugineus]|uniref:B30.2/SPRY domain-containing protein n=1 Tax=Rhynchophorus ferrugineus TaxID=354439 RepID=A0A834HKZ3_RHYFE|nr:hypothetical protein GWI33_003148 [Rhynchophorus ferrugineus]
MVLCIYCCCDISENHECLPVKDVPPLMNESPACPRLKIFCHMQSLPRCVVRHHGWSRTNRSQNILVNTNDPTVCFRVKSSQSTDCIRGNVGYTEGTHCWEIHWPRTKRGTHALVGVATEDAPLQGPYLMNLVGNNKHSWGWNLWTNMLHHDSENEKTVPYPNFRDKYVKYAAPDKFMVMLDMDQGTLSFIVDGRNLGIAFTGLKGKTLYPIISVVFGESQVTMSYIGGLGNTPPSLKALSRLLIRETVGRCHIGTATKRLNIPETLMEYVSNSRERHLD